MAQSADTPPKPVQLAQVTGISSPATRWGSVASSLTPARAAAILRAARSGDADAYLTLAEEIEERDLQYASVLGTRKLAITGVEPEVTPGKVKARTTRGSAPRSDEKRAELIAADYQESVVEAPWFGGMVHDFLDALGKGYSVLQPDWDTSEAQWNYKAFKWCDPRFFQWDTETLSELRIKSPNRAEGIRIVPGTFVVHRPLLKTGVPIRGGLAMLATVAHVSKSFTLADWLAFCEVYGMPIRIAHYDPLNMSQPEIDALKIAIANIGHDAAALIPIGTKLELMDGRTPPGATNTFGELVRYWDAALSKAIIGQTMTADDGASLAQAKVHNEVRLDIRRADARALEITIREQVTAPWVRYNYGEDAPVPRVTFGVDPPEDLLQWTQALLPWVEKGGLRIKTSEIRERFGLDAPEGEEDDILHVAPKPAAPAGGKVPSDTPAA